MYAVFVCPHFFKSSSQFKASNDDLGSASIQYHKIVSVSRGFATKCHWVGNNVSSKVNLFSSRKMKCFKANILSGKNIQSLRRLPVTYFNNLELYLKVFVWGKLSWYIEILIKCLYQIEHCVTYFCMGWIESRHR